MKREELLSLLQGIWICDSDNFGFRILGEMVVEPEKNAAPIGITWQPNLNKWSISLSGFGSLICIIDKLDRDSMTFTRVSDNETFELRKIPGSARL